MKQIFTLLMCVPALLLAQELPEVTNLPEVESASSEIDLQNKIFEKVEIEPQFSDDHQKLKPWLREKITRARKANPKLPKGTVQIKFVVEKNGSISTLTYPVKASKKLKKETVNILVSMPKWRPAQQNGQPVRAYVTLDFEW